MRPLPWQVAIREDGFDGTSRHASAAIYADLRVDKELWIVLRAMDAVHRAHVNAGFVFGAYAWFSDNVWHRSLA